MPRFVGHILRTLLALVAVVWAAAFMAGAAYEAPAGIRDGHAGTMVDVSGVRLRVLQEGSGRDILMIHGSPGILEDFEPQAAELRGQFRVTRYDRPSHGMSEDGGEYSLEYNARMALALIEKLGLERTVVVGHSYGGSTALALGRLKSPRVASLVILDSAVYAPIRPVSGIYRFVRHGSFGLGLARIVPRSRTQARVAVAIGAEFRAGPPPEGFLEMRTPLFAEPKVVHAIANEHWNSAAWLAAQSPHYGEIDVPVYVVAQRDDPARRETAERLHGEVRGAELLLASPSGHYVQLEQSQAVTELIRRAALR